MATKKETRRLRIKRGIRKKVVGTAERPRLAVFRSNKAIYAQLINDTTGTSLGSIGSAKVDQKLNKTEQAKQVGVEIAKLAQGKKVEAVVFDRGGSLYHGRVKSLAEGAREGGLKF